MNTFNEAKKAYVTIGGEHKTVNKIYKVIDGIWVLVYPTIIPLDPELVAMLKDFTYTDNGDGTVTLETWLETLNGEPSTECVIPNDSRIIL